MKNYGFLRVASCSPEVKPADIGFNIKQIITNLERCEEEECDIAVFPELCITGYTCADLFDQTLLIEKAKEGLLKLAEDTKSLRMLIAVGLPIEINNRLYNCASILHRGKIVGIVAKRYIPNYGEFYEKRWFCSGNELSDVIMLNTNLEQCEQGTIPFGNNLLFNISGTGIGIELCEDLWVPTPPSNALAMAGAQVILNLSATNELIGKHKYLIDLISSQSARCRCAYVYASAGLGESSTDLAFAGNCIIAENGAILSQSERFSMTDKIAISDIDIENINHDRKHFGTFKDNYSSHCVRIVETGKEITEKTDLLKYRKVKSHPFLDSDKTKMAERCSEISSIQAWGLAVRLRAIGCKKAVVGISGGLDSTLALLVTVKAFDMLNLDRKGIIGITMPGFGTTDRTKSNASTLMDLLGVTQREIAIGASVRQHFKDIGQSEDKHDVTYENGQARERTQILMDVANMENAIVIGTGDLSELALGWCTYNGDQMSMYGVNASIPKTLVKYLVNGYAEESDDKSLTNVLLDIIDTPISPELLPPDSQDKILQKTEDVVGPYELHDFFLYNAIRFGMKPEKIFLLAKKAYDNVYDEATIKKWLTTFYRRFFTQQFKRSCMPDGVKAGSVCLSPRGDWRMPSDASSAIWNTKF